MIAWMRGIVKALEEDSLILDVNGLGYQIYTPMSQFDALPEIGDELELHTTLIVREDLLQLFGFLEREQLAMFRLLNSVSGVGAKTALAALNTLSPALIVQGVLSDNANTFQAVPGIGKKLGQRLVLELKDKCAKLGYSIGNEKTFNKGPSDSLGVLPGQEVITALTQLGYSAMESRALAAHAQKNLGETASLEELVLEALKLASR